MKNYKHRILPDGFYGSFFDEEFIEKRLETIVNGQLVSEWTLTDKSPDVNLLKAFWSGNDWIEGITEDELIERKQSQKQNITLEYKNRIKQFLTPYKDLTLFDGTPIPEEILDERDRLNAECEAKISGLGISNQDK